MLCQALPSLSRFVPLGGCRRVELCPGLGLGAASRLHRLHRLHPGSTGCTDLLPSNSCFSLPPLRLAQSRTNPQVLDTGLTAQDIQGAEALSAADWGRLDAGAGEGDELFMF